MERILHIAIALIMIAVVTACASPENKWSKDKSMASETSSTNGSDWQTDSGANDTNKKASSSYWKDDSRY